MVGSAKRRLYTDDDLHVYDYRRALMLTSIDPGALRGDLAERLMPVELRSLKRRRSEERLMRDFEKRLPLILGGLFDLVAAVLANPVHVRRPPRMVDAAKVMAAVDAQLGSDSLGAYRASQDRLVDTVLEGDPVAAALMAFLAAEEGEWRGTSTELYKALTDRVTDARRSNWPANARAPSARLARLRPALQKAHGIRAQKVRSGRREWQFRWRGAPAPPRVRVKAQAG